MGRGSRDNTLGRNIRQCRPASATRRESLQSVAISRLPSGCLARQGSPRRSDRGEDIVFQDSVERFSRKDVFELVQAVWERNELLDPESRLALVKIRDAFLFNGLGLTDESAAARVQEIAARSKDACREYIDNINDSVLGQWFSLTELEGVPEAHLNRWKRDGDRRWVDYKLPNYLAVIEYAERSDVRQRIWIGKENRFRDSNGPLQKEIIVLRDEAARLLGFPHYAALEEKNRMLDTATARSLMQRLRGVLTERAKQEVEQLAKDHASRSPDVVANSEIVFRWDLPFYSRQLKMHHFNVDSNKVAEYFEFHNSLKRVLSLLEALFGVKFVQHRVGPGGVSVWHADVLAYEVWDDSEGDFRGYLYLDVFPRDHKYSHVGHMAIQRVGLHKQSLFPPTLFFFFFFSSLRPNTLTRAMIVRMAHATTPAPCSSATTRRRRTRGRACSDIGSCIRASTSWDTRYTTSCPRPSTRVSTGRWWRETLLMCRAGCWRTCYGIGG